MTAGLASATANSILNVFRNTAYAAIAAVYAQLHVGDPGAAGTANLSAVTTRNQVTWAAPSGGSMVLSALASYTMTVSETITHVSLWTAATAGTFLQSGALTAGVPVVNGSVLSFSSFTLAFQPIAA